MNHLEACLIAALVAVALISTLYIITEGGTNPAALNAGYVVDYTPIESDRRQYANIEGSVVEVYVWEVTYRDINGRYSECPYFTSVGTKPSRNLFIVCRSTSGIVYK